jgi:ferredoxin
MPGTEVHEEKCTGCGACIKACPNGAYVLMDDKANKANPDKCNPIDCVVCIYACPERAINLTY